ncbi:MAG TPA: hypothetical protein VFQ44_30330 [Streptosporangiaceae bacterium]|nr:hypothetical protein [Streptosporangiaceae bacterium]
MSDPGWFRIGDGTGSDIVLAVDADGTARNEATFHDLAPMLAGICDVRLTTMPDAPCDDTAQASVLEYLDGWSRTVAVSAPQVRAVFGYCSGGLVALSLADRLEDVHGARPEVILFDPERPTALTLYQEFTHTVRAMSALDPEEADIYVRRARRVTQEHQSRLERVIRGITELYREACGTNLVRLGLSPDLGAELAMAFQRYGAYLLCASQITWEGPRWNDATALLSADTAADGFDCLRIRIDTVRKNLLRSEVTAAQVRRLMRRGAA